ncbi:MAG: hypothetical protein ACRC5M_04615 [Anaeroplasmataceae bacterium]
MTKNKLSSILYQDFGVEDFESGRVIGQESLASVTVANKLGLLNAIADRNNTDPMNFALESATLLGESVGINKFVSGQLHDMNQRFAIAAQIKTRYGVEGFDPFAFGCEGFGDKLKGAFTAIVAAIKKIIQSISNWIRGVMNWVGSQFAKTQAKLVEKYKGSKFTAKATIKAIVPASKISSGESLIKEVSDAVTKIAKVVRDSNAAIVKGNIEKSSNIKNVGDSIGGIKGVGLQGITFGNQQGKKLSITKLGSATNIANQVVFGTQKPNKVTVDASSYITTKVIWTSILSKEDLKTTNTLVKEGKTMIKILDESLKTADRLSKEARVSGSKKSLSDADKEQNASVKSARGAIMALNNNNRVCSLATGILYGVFANYLKLRTYAASAVRALVAANNTGKKAPKEGSGKARYNKLVSELDK